MGDNDLTANVRNEDADGRKERRMEDNKKMSFPEVLNKRILAFKADPCDRTYTGLLCCVFDGIEKDVSVPMPAELDAEDITIRPSFMDSAKGEPALVILSVPDGEMYPCVVNVKLRAAMRVVLDKADCIGIIIDPNTESEVFVSKSLMTSAIGAGLAMLEEGIEKEKVRKMKLHRPVDEETFDSIAEQISRFRDDPGDYIILDLIDDKDMLFIQATRSGSDLHVELAFDMSDFEWDHPLILGHEMPLAEALDLLHQLCVDGESPDDIDVVYNEFHYMDIWKESTP